MAGFTLPAIAAASVPTPAAGKVTVFFNLDTSQPSYKNDAGSVSPLGTAGSEGPPGDPGEPGQDANTFFPGGWT